jgi:hypothetical protein
MRPLIGQLGLGTEKHDLTVEAAVTQTRRDRVSRGPAADDQRSLWRVNSRRWRSEI